MEFQTMYFTVETIDGDYAHPRRMDEEGGEPKLVARALLPEEITEGSKLKDENCVFILASVPENTAQMGTCLRHAQNTRCSSMRS